MEFLPYNNSVQVFQPPFGHHSNSHEYVLYPDAHTAYAMPRRSASMTNMNQVAMAGHTEKNDSKPRLSKSEVEILERQFQEQHKPTSNTKRQLAERMRVDISRINNWFQNRRAKAKQEKKQAEYGLRQANSLSYSEPSSPERFTPIGYPDHSIQPSQNIVVPPFSGVSGPYHTGHENLTAVASMDPIRGTIYNGEAAASLPLQRGGFSEVCEDRRENHFAMSMPFDGLPAGDRAPFPVPAHSGVGFPDRAVYNTDIYMVAGHNSPVIMRDPSADLYPYFMGESQSAIPETEVPFPSQLLENANGDYTPTPRQFESAEVNSVKHKPEESPAQPDGSESRLKFPPASNIAARRNKPKPTSLGTPAIRDRSSTGPKTAGNADAGKRMNGSPSSAMRRISSVSGSLNVLGSRIQKHAGYMPQRSPLQRQFALGDTAAFFEKNAQSLNPSTAPAPWFNKPLDPPTPSSPRDSQLLQKESGGGKRDETASQGESSSDDQRVSPGGNSTSPPSEEEASYFANRIPVCFPPMGLNNMASPPETPANPQHPHPHWALEVPDEPLRTPGFGMFTADGPMQMPQPHYVSPLACSQPPTPAFGQFTNFPYPHQSPVFDMAPLDPAAMEYYFPESSIAPYSMSSSSKSPEQQRERIYNFHNATQKDFE